MTDQDFIDTILETKERALAQLTQSRSIESEQTEQSDSKTKELQQDSSQMDMP